jgi:hypothetical protein
VSDGASLFDALARYVRVQLEPGRIQVDADEDEEHDPGIVLVELIADVGNALSNYADRVAAEERLRTRRRGVAVAAALVVAVAWSCRGRRRRQRETEGTG